MRTLKRTTYFAAAFILSASLLWSQANTQSGVKTPADILKENDSAVATSINEFVLADYLP